jgi:hypothetical protein
MQDGPGSVESKNYQTNPFHEFLYGCDASRYCLCLTDGFQERTHYGGRSYKECRKQGIEEPKMGMDWIGSCVLSRGQSCLVVPSRRGLW